MTMTKTMHYWRRSKLFEPQLLLKSSSLPDGQLLQLGGLEVETEKKCLALGAWDSRDPGSLLLLLLWSGGGRDVGGVHRSLGGERLWHEGCRCHRGCLGSLCGCLSCLCGVCGGRCLCGCGCGCGCGGWVGDERGSCQAGWEEQGKLEGSSLGAIWRI